MPLNKRPLGAARQDDQGDATYVEVLRGGLRPAASPFEHDFHPPRRFPRIFHGRLFRPRQIIVVPANLTSRPQEVVEALGRSGLYFRRTWEQVSTVREICGNESWFAFRRGGVQCEW